MAGAVSSRRFYLVLNKTKEEATINTIQAGCKETTFFDDGDQAPGGVRESPPLESFKIHLMETLSCQVIPEVSGFLQEHSEAVWKEIYSCVTRQSALLTLLQPLVGRHLGARQVVGSGVGRTFCPAPPRRRHSPARAGKGERSPWAELRP